MDETIQKFIDLGYDWLRWYHPKEAEIVFRAVLLIDENNYQAMCGLSAVFKKEGDLDTSLIMLNNAMRIYQDADMWNAKGILLQQKEEYEKSLSCFNRAILLDRNNSEYHVNKAVSLGKLDRVCKEDIRIAEELV